MLENSKLSNRFNKKEVITYTALPKKFVFAKNNINDDEQPQAQISENASTIAQTELNIEEIKENFLNKISAIPVWGEYSDAKKQDLVESFLDSTYNIKNSELVSQLLDSVKGFGVIDYLIKQENVSAVFVNGTNNVYIEINGKVLNTEIKLSIISPQISLNGIYIIIRKIKDSDINTLLNNDFASKEIFDFLISAINAKKNIVISGRINSGKTTLLNAILKDILPNKRLILLEKIPQINAESDQTIKLLTAPNSDNFDDLLESTEKLLSEYTLTDLNTPIPQILERIGKITTLRANSADSALAKLVNNCISHENLPEKNARQLVLKNYDYIVQIDTIDGVRRISTITELTPARTTALSVKPVAIWVNGAYETNFPQPLTSILADSLISQAGSMTARFYHQD